jgi:hypothetical protein
MGRHFSAVRATCYNRQTDATVSATVFPFDRVTTRADRSAVPPCYRKKSCHRSPTECLMALNFELTNWENT